MAKIDKKAQTQDKESAFSELSKKFKANPAVFIGTVFVLVLVTVSFVVVPAIVPENRGAGDLTFGYYDRAPISWVPGNRFSQYVEQVSRQYRDSMDINDFHTLRMIWFQAFQAAAVHTAVLQEIKRSNFEIPERIVDREVARLPQFQVNGVFSPALYRQMSDTSRLSLWRQVRDERAVIQYYNDLFTLSVPENEKNFFENMGSDKRTFELVSFIVDDFPESEYLAFAESNAPLFSSIHLSRILVPSEREARRILDSVQNGTSTFEDAARSQSQDSSFADSGGDMGIRFAFELEREIPVASHNIIFGLGKGELSDVIRIDDAWGFFRIEEEFKHADFDDAATMNRVRSYIRSFQRGRMEDWAIDQAREFIADAEVSGFNNAALTRNKETHRIGPFPINFGSSDLFPSLEVSPIPVFSRNELSELSSNMNFWRVAFSTPLNIPSQPIVQGRNVLVLLPVEQEEPEPEPELETEDEFDMDIASLYSSWLNFYTERSLPPYFMNSPRMDDRFSETFFRYFRPSDDI